MKKYSKPFLKTDAINSISEPVYLYSGPWDRSTCYTSYLKGVQDPETGRCAFTVQVYGHHISEDADYLASGGFPHHNQHQLLIFKFDHAIPEGITGTLNNLPLEFNGDRTKCRTLQQYHQNFTEDIGSGSFFMELFGFTESQLADTEYIEQFLPVDFLISDIGYRNCQHGDWN